MTATRSNVRPVDELAVWDAHTHASRHAILTTFWRSLDPATARARFAAAADLLSLVNERLTSMQATVNGIGSQDTR
ncbi:hypothetical protein [Nonomuraea sp. NPDC050202]|uniref:hypothetical protein n=1 Tax=Nonomuraea sp. NPDC050202 TaxID=3155035 RepID=UPI0033C89770